jgi:predicted transglutaminase-like cysteine proteinase
MRTCSLASHAIVAAALLVLLPGHIGAGEADVSGLSQVRVAVLTEQAATRSLPGASRAEIALLEKWRAVRVRVGHEQRLVARCRVDPSDCASDTATEFMAIVDAARVREGRARIGEINRAINLAIRPVPDMRRHGAADVWTAPLATLAAGQGDCEDYAIAKLGALWAAGVAESDTRLVIVHDDRTREDHAIAMVRLDRRWLALDNKRFTLIEAVHLNYRPLFALGGNGVRSLTGPHGWAALDEDASFALSATDEPGPSGFHSGPVLL